MKSFKSFVLEQTRIKESSGLFEHVSHISNKRNKKLISNVRK